MILDNGDYVVSIPALSGYNTEPGPLVVAEVMATTKERATLDNEVMVLRKPMGGGRYGRWARTFGFSGDYNFGRSGSTLVPVRRQDLGTFLAYWRVRRQVEQKLLHLADELQRALHKTQTVAEVQAFERTMLDPLVALAASYTSPTPPADGQ